MLQTIGREHAKRNIVIFVIGTFLILLGTLIPAIGELANNQWLSLVALLGLVGFVLQVIAIIHLRNVNKYYANALWALIFDLTVTTVNIILSIVAIFNEGNTIIPTVCDWLDIASSVFEALVVINFVLGTNVLAAEGGKAMPKLTKIIVLAYMGIFLLSLIFNLVSLIPAVRGNETVVVVFGIIAVVLYILREIAYLFFLIRSLWRVE